jgi:hypothetical protein
MINVSLIVSCDPLPFINLRTRFLLGGVVTSRVTEATLKSLKVVIKS